MELRHIQYFVVVAEELHFRKAAKRLNMSQPPLSQQIQLLERELGVTLFERGTRDVKLTKEGEVVLKQAYQLLDSSKRLISAAEQAKKGKTGVLSAACAPYAFPEFLPPIFNAYCKQYPDVDVVLHESNTANTISKLLDGTLDVGIVRINEVEPPLASIPLRKDRLIAIVPEGHRLSGKQCIKLSTLADEPFVIVKKQVSPQFYASILPACQKAGFYPNIAHEVHSVQGQVGYVACKLGIALLPQSLKHTFNSSIVYIDLKENIELSEFCVIWNTKNKSELVNQFITISKKVFS